MDLAFLRPLLKLMFTVIFHHYFLCSLSNIMDVMFAMLGL